VCARARTRTSERASEQQGGRASERQKERERERERARERGKDKVTEGSTGQRLLEKGQLSTIAARAFHGFGEYPKVTCVDGVRMTVRHVDDHDVSLQDPFLGQL